MSILIRGKIQLFPIGIFYFLRNKEAALTKAALRVSDSFINKLNT
ncbi:hypothetical protein B4080_0169 [Bacillus cereus]|nr:hypothetical protein B4080_0169 [Bacillus cereus]